MPIPQPQTPQTRSSIPTARAPAPNLPPPRERFEPVAAVLAFLLPGAGHFFLGERKRAGLIAMGILGLFFGGILIGGIDVIDRREDTIWFAGQALVGPLAFGVDHLHQQYFKVFDQGQLRSARPGESRDPQGRAIAAAPGQLPPNTKSLGRMNELGTLFATIAGMLNLIVIIDAALHTRRREPAY
jgi:uncharacterized protein DUF6677